MKSKDTDVKDFVYQTKEYGKFKPLRGNRKVSNVKVQRLVKAFQEYGYYPIPILVNEEFEVIDGQHRLEACRITKLPVLYVVHGGIGLRECQVINSASSNWTLQDYIQSYIDQGIEDYKVLSDFITKYRSMTGISGTLRILSLFSDYNSHVDVKEGLFIFKSPEEKARAYKAFEYLAECNGIVGPIPGGQREFLTALSVCWVSEDVDNDKMKSQLARNPFKVRECAVKKEMFRQLIEVYNTRAQEKNRLLADVVYKKMQEQYYKKVPRC